MSKIPKKYRFVSLFCGLGGLDLGFLWEGYEVAWANDSSRHATRTYEMNLGHEAFCQDIGNISNSEVPDSDIIIGGPPCQAFSLMGQRDPDDQRGELIFQFFQIIRDKVPRAFAMENVLGMAASRINGVRLPDYLKNEFSRLGYKVLLMALMATDFLVPQRRKRLFLVGCLDALPEIPDPILFARECYGIDAKEYDYSARAAIGDLGDCTAKGKRSPYRAVRQSVFAKIMRSADLPDVSLHECPRMSETDRLIVAHIPPGGNYRDIPDEIAPGRVLKYKRSGGRTTTYGRLHPDKPSYTINTYFRRPNVGCNFHYSQSRLITSREAMRFQSIPDHFELDFNSQDGRNALIGNAVPPLMARAVAWSLKRTLNGTAGHPSNQRDHMFQLDLF